MIKKVVISAISILLVFCLLYFVPFPARVSFRLDGTVRGTEPPAACSVSFHGYEFRHLMKDNRLKGAIDVALDASNFTFDISGPIVSIPDGDPNENISWLSGSRYDKDLNQYVPYTLYFTDDQKTFVLKENGRYFCVSELREAEAEIIFDQILDFTA